MNSMMNLFIGAAGHSEVQAEPCADNIGAGSEGQNSSFWNLVQSFVGDRQEPKLMGCQTGESESVAAQESTGGPDISRMIRLETVEGQDVPQEDGIRAGQQTVQEKDVDDPQSDASDIQHLTMLGSLGVVQQAPAMPVEVEYIQAPLPQSTVVVTNNTGRPSTTTIPTEGLQEPVADASGDTQVSQPSVDAVRPEVRPTQQTEVQAPTNPVARQIVAEESDFGPRETATPAEPKAASRAAASGISTEEVETQSAEVKAAAQTAQRSADGRGAVSTDRRTPIPITHVGQGVAEPVEILSQAQGVVSRGAGQGQGESFRGVTGPQLQNVAQPTVKPIETSNGMEMNAAGKHIPAPPLDPGLIINNQSQAAPVERVHTQPAGEIGTRVINQIVKAARTQIFDGGAAMTLRLDPPHLGTVRMNVVAIEGAVTATLEAGTESARRIIEANLGVLRESLAQAGVNVDSINVSVNNNQDYGWRWNGRQGEPGNGHPNAPWNSRTDEAKDDPHPLLMTAARSYSSSGFDYLA